VKRATLTKRKLSAPKAAPVQTAVTTAAPVQTAAAESTEKVPGFTALLAVGIFFAGYLMIGRRE